MLSLHQYGIAAVARDSIQCLPESKGATKLGPSFETPCGRLSVNILSIAVCLTLKCSILSAVVLHFKLG